jgi:hypothetical protein
VVIKLMADVQQKTIEPFIQGISQEQLLLYLGFFECVPNARK